MDDQDSWREMLHGVVRATPGLTVVGEARSGEASLDAVVRLAPRLVIMDVRMPGMGGVDATRRLTAAHPGLVVVLVSVDDKDVAGIVSCGAAAFVRKEQLSPGTLGAVWEEHQVNGAQPA